MTCCFPPILLDGRFIQRCKQGCLQFVILKPILVAVTLILYAKGKYHDGNFRLDQSYLYLTIIYTISYFIGPLCTGLVLCSLQRFASAIQSSSKVHNNQVRCFPDLLAGHLEAIAH
ncbi:uncharacterized protein LOC127810312 [Diospyros lotus]|uniref:uncharacterized protein LOC127810312 n=1 Tax=Diospyros lotus TaxID=55363 RepID=UPI00225648C9|nr:uncharacterized protein LOC127810312 [Diospyros lotus]